MGGFRPPEPDVFVASRALPGMIASSVEFDNETSDAFTIIDISARDRVGFLYIVTKTLYDLNLDIGSAKIVTEGYRVMDSFYITDLLKRKITERERLEKIKSELVRVIG
jgi:[protein-PII] uridylyltransferase